MKPTRAGTTENIEEPPARSLVLGFEALPLLLRNGRRMAARIEASQQIGVPVLVSVLTSDLDDWSKLCGSRVIIKEV